MTDYIMRTVIYTKGRAGGDPTVAHYFVVSSDSGQGFSIASVVGLNIDSAAGAIPAAMGTSPDDAFDKAIAGLDKLHPAPIWEKTVAARR